MSSSSVTTSLRPFIAIDMSSVDASDNSCSDAEKARLGDDRLIELSAMTLTVLAATSMFSPATTSKSPLTPRLASPVATRISSLAKISAVMARSSACPVVADSDDPAVTVALSLRKSKSNAALISAFSPNDSSRKSAAEMATSPPANTSRSFVVRRSAASANASNRVAIAESVSVDTSIFLLFIVMESIASTSKAFVIVSTSCAVVLTECSASRRRLPPTSVLK